MLVSLYQYAKYVNVMHINTDLIVLILTGNQLEERKEQVLPKDFQGG